MENQAKTDVVEIPSDKDINPSRGRWQRILTLGGHLAGTGFVSKTFSYHLATLPFIGDGGVVTNKLIGGLADGASWMAAIAVIGFTVPKYFLIRNDPNRMFLTQNGLASLFSYGQVDVAYGPGLHPCFPWEKRIEGNNISLDEVTVEFDFTATLADGSITGKGNYWLRPDHTDPVRFLRSVASVGEEIQTLIVAAIQDYMASSEFRDERIPANDTTVITHLINQHLEKLFGDNNDHRKEGVEKRNAVIISGAAIEGVEVSGDLSKTITGIAEARAVQTGTALLLGYANDNEMAEALKKGAIGQEDVARARRDFLSISGNFEGMTVQRNEVDFNIRGLSPEAIDKVIELAKTPAAQAVATATARSRGGNNQGKKTNK